MKPATKQLPFGPLVSLRRLEFLLGRNRSDLRRIAMRAGRYYEPFDLLAPDKTKWRHIDNPFGELKTLQSRIYRAILAEYEFPDNVVGGIPGHSIIDNVEPHLNQPVVVALDIRNCFPSIDNRLVFDSFRGLLGFSGEVSSLLTRLTTYQRRLPQGAPSSPIIANLVLQPLHRELERIAIAFGLNWSIYVDDITVSGRRARSAIDPIIRAVQRAGFAVSHHKIHVMSNAKRQSVTGVIVNGKSFSAGRERIEKIREATLNLHERDAVTQFDVQSLIGKIRYVTWLNEDQGSVLQKLAEALIPEAGDVGSRIRPERRLCNCFARKHAASAKGPLIMRTAICSRGSEKVSKRSVLLPHATRR